MGGVSMRTITTARCTSCGARGATPRHQVGDHTYVGCGACGAAWLDAPDGFDAGALFDEGYFVEGTDRGGYPDYDADAAHHRRNAAERMARLARFLPCRERPTLIDVGCASGYVLDAAAELGWTVAGVDASAWARRVVGERGVPAFATLDEALELTPRPDAIAFFQSLEHFHDPATAVATALGSLPVGGVLVVETWDADSTVAKVSGARWQQVNPPTVRHLFTRRSMRHLIERAGGHVVESRSTSKVVSPRLAAAVVAHRAPRLAGPLTRVTDGRLGAIGVRYRLGDLVTVVAVKCSPDRRDG